MKETNRPSECGYQERLVAYLYDETSASERTEFERHLQACDVCCAELASFKEVRNELRAWEIPFVPPIKVAVPRRAGEVLRELLGVLPKWFKVSGGLVATAAAALVVFTLAGARLSIGASGVSAEFGHVSGPQVAREATPAPVAPTKQDGSATPTLTRAEAEAMINAAVARAQAQAKQEAQAQMASLEVRLIAAHRAELTQATNKLRDEHRQSLRSVLAERQRPTINEWLFAANENADPTGGENGNSNE